MPSLTEQQTNGNKKMSSRSCFKRAWWAIKGTFTRSGKHKVVPFSSPSDPDPSDLQENPYVQTQLRVFKHTGIQNLGEFLPGSCNWEQTLLEYPDDPQPGPSGQSLAPQVQADSQPPLSNLEQKSLQDPEVFLHGASGLEPCASQSQSDTKSGAPGLKPTVPEEQTDHRPEQQTKRRKKMSSPACFKRAWRAVKGTFSRTRKNKVAPFHPDPSDLQKDPYVQTDFRVFNIVGRQDLCDFLPGACNWDQTPLECPADPQPGPSGLQSAAPEEPADHQTESFSALYEVGSKLGSGLAGTVHEGICRSDDQKVAIKFIKGVQHFGYNLPGHINPVFREVALNLQLHKPEKCPYIVEMLHWFEEENQQIIIMEYPQPCSTLYDFLSCRCVSETLARDFMRQAVVAAKHWIDHGVHHGDLTLKNILVNTETLQIKFIDFGLGRLISASSLPLSGYCDRTCALSETVCGLGNMLYKMLKCEDDQMYRSTATQPLSKECLDLIERSMYPKPGNKLTLDKFLDHEWFKQG